VAGGAAGLTRSTASQIGGFDAARPLHEQLDSQENVMLSRHRKLVFALAFATLAASTGSAWSAPAPAGSCVVQPRGWFGRLWSKLGGQPGATSEKLRVRDVWHKVREEFQLYRGDRLERLADRLAIGRTDFDPKRSVAENLKALVDEKQLPHYYAEVGGKQVLHVVIDLAQGGRTKQALRGVLRRVGAQTIELNYKASNEKNRYGHVAVRVGAGATFDLTGSRGVAELPQPIAKLLGALRGQSDFSFARRRNLRRFMETRRDGPDVSAGLFYGMLLAASPAEVKATETIYKERQRTMTGFSVSGGDAAKGVWSCAQFLTEGVPYLNQAGIAGTVGARSAASAARRSPALEAVLVYKTPRITDSEVASSLP
jgi:hypothetical protein